jgi:hypothetical protein
VDATAHVKVSVLLTTTEVSSTHSQISALPFAIIVDLRIAPLQH